MEAEQTPRMGEPEVNDEVANNEQLYLGVDPPIYQDRPRHQRRMPSYLQSYLLLMQHT